MFYEIHAKVYRWLRESAGLSQRELAKTSGLSLRSVQRIESGEKTPSAAEESVIAEAVACSRPLFAETVCKALSEYLGEQVTILPGGAGGYRPATPLGEVNQLLHAAFEHMPRDQWWPWIERLTRLKAQTLVPEQEALAMRRELQAELSALEAKKEGSDAV